jgi:FixJ family two-component response regulator
VRLRPEIRIILMTGHDAGPMIGQAMKRPPIVLQKPFWFEDLLQILATTFAAKAV